MKLFSIARDQRDRRLSARQIAIFDGADISARFGSRFCELTHECGSITDDAPRPRYINERRTV